MLHRGPFVHCCWHDRIASRRWPASSSLALALQFLLSSPSSLALDLQLQLSSSAFQLQISRSLALLDRGMFFSGSSRRYDDVDVKRENLLHLVMTGQCGQCRTFLLPSLVFIKDLLYIYISNSIVFMGVRRLESCCCLIGPKTTVNTKHCVSFYVRDDFYYLYYYCLFEETIKYIHEQKCTKKG